MFQSKPIYWSVLDPGVTNTGFGYSELTQIAPTPLIKEIDDILGLSNLEKGDFILDYLRCPAASNLLRNIYVIKQPKDYTIEKFGKTIQTSDRSKKDFEVYVDIKPSQEHVIDIRNQFMFFSETSIKATAIPAFYHKNSFTENTTLFSGSFDISKWYRPLLPTFIMNSKKIDIKRGDALFYVYFETDQKTVMKGYEFDLELESFMGKCMWVKKGCPTKKLSFLYDLFTQKNYNKRILKKIKENLTGY